MIPRQFPLMVVAEIRKVFTRGSGVGACVVAALVGVVAALALHKAATMQGASVNGQAVNQLVTASAIQASGWALRMRNFFVLPMLLLLSAASAVAGEVADRTLRELFVRPVPRVAVLAAKLVALSALSAVTLVITFLPSFALGLAFFGMPEAGGGPTVPALLGGYGASFLSDIGLLVIGMLVSLFVSSPGGVVVAVVLVLAADRAAWLVLKLMTMLQVSGAEAAMQWTLVNALGCWEGWEDGWVPARFVALAILTVGASAIGVARVGRIDVP